MTTYVLGAGASRHAGYPLAAELGSELFNWISHAGAGFERFRSGVETLHKMYDGLVDLERILTELDECPPDSRAATLRESERGFIRQAVEHSIPGYFNQIRDQPAPLYDRLAKDLIQASDVILTFNYDVACERSLKRTGSWEISDGYGFSLGINMIPPSKVKVLKLHGSTNWWGPIFNGMRGLFQGGPTSLPIRPVVLFPRDFEYFGYSDQLRDAEYSGSSNPGVRTALIMPTHHKRFYVGSSPGREWGSFWNDLWSQAADALYASEKIVILGYSLPVADQEARKLLLETPTKDAEITLVCGSRSNPIREEFKSHGFTRVEVVQSGRFEEFLASGFRN